MFTSIWFYSLISVVVVSLVSLVGVFSLSLRMDVLKKIVIYMVSFAAGAILGDVFFHMLPQLTEELSGFSGAFELSVSIFILSGILFSFVLEKFIFWRHCHTPISDHHIHPFAYTNLFGEFVHNFIDGLIIGSSYLISTHVGLATTLAVIFHEIPQEIGDFGVLVHAGFSRAKALFMNFLVSLSAIFGVVFILGMAPTNDAGQFLIPFAIGNFIYIAVADLIPELHKESEGKKSILQFIFIVFGVVAMYAILLLE